jgi:hypothetical protein
LDGPLSAEDIREVTGDERADPGAGGHRGRDSALDIGGRAGALPIGIQIEGALVEEAEVGGGGLQERLAMEFFEVYQKHTMMADIDEISKPNKAPPTTATAAMA